MSVIAGVDFDPSSDVFNPAAPHVIRDPYPWYDVLRELDPVHKGVNGMRFLTRYADVDRVLRDHRTFVDDHGVTVHYYVWSPGKPRGVVQIAHGVGEHALRYEALAQDLVNRGYAVYADDHRGHGATGVEQWAGDLTKIGRLGVGDTPGAAQRGAETVQDFRVFGLEPRGAAEGVAGLGMTPRVIRRHRGFEAFLKVDRGHARHRTRLGRSRFTKP